MKAVIPAAGQGTRLYPQTHTKPKAMVRLAGRPILGHILASLAETEIEEVVIVVGGPMREQITEFARNSFGDRFEFQFVIQAQAEGLGHSIYQTTEAVGDEPMLIALGDMLFENGYETFLRAHSDLKDVTASIGVKAVAEPQHYGVVVTDEAGWVERLEEKPEYPPSNLAISGVYIVENSTELFDALDHLVSNDIRGSGDEYQLTDALDRMAQDGSRLGVFEVEDWYDCGRPSTLIEANRVLLEKLDSSLRRSETEAVFVPPVDVGDGVTVDASVVGPHVSIDDGGVLRDSIVRDTIIGRNATLDGVNLTRSIVGDNAKVEGEANHLNVGDNSTIHL